MSHAVIIGDSGMLQDVSIWLANAYDTVTVVSRNAKKMAPLLEAAPSIQPLYLNYENTAELEKTISRQIEKVGPVDLLVAWIHSSAPEALPALVTTITKQATAHWHIIHVLGSQATSTSLATKNCTYSKVQLGFIQQPSHSRWLTHQEISAGVIQAIQQKDTQRYSLVGVIKPWHNRPQ